MSFTVYKSSAGSGKTYTLVKEYLKIALGQESNLRYRNILAITFTNKAASEMKERVITALTEMSSGLPLSGTSYFLMQDLVDELKTGEDKIRLKSSAVLSSMLHHYSDISISTIDKFVHKIVRSFAYDLQIPINFTVELDSDTILQTAVDTLMMRVGQDEKLTQALISFTERKAEEDKSWKIEEDLKKFSANLLKDQFASHINKLKLLSLNDFTKIRLHLEDRIFQFEMDLQKIGEQALNFIKSEGIEHKQLAGGAIAGIGKYFFYLAKKRSDNYSPNNRVQGYFSEGKFSASKNKKELRDRIDSIGPSLTKFYADAQSIIERDYSDYLLFCAVNKNIYALSLLNQVEKIVDEIKRDNNIVHISEFGKKISAVVVHEPVPFIYERLGERYKNYLIDEFQDTSTVQWQNFIPLIENSLANGNFTMVVGDAKQSIYRWRGGEVEQFTSLPNILGSDKDSILKFREDSLSRNYQRKSLNVNRRSKREIVEFNNAFFNFIVKNDSFPEFLKPIYDSLDQQFDPNNVGGCVHFNFLNNKIEGFDSDQANSVHVLKIIQRALADGYSLSDIAILTRSNKNGVTISKFLIESGIDVISKESLLVSTASSVNFLISVLHYLNNSKDKIAIAAMHDFMKAKGKEAGFDKLTQPDQNFNQLLIENYPDWNRKRLLQLPLYELCEELLRLFHLNQKSDPYIVFFLDAVHNYATKKNNSIADFLEWWQIKKETLSIVIPDGTNAVNLLTIHKSKGLEFPIVIFPYAHSLPKIPSDVWADFEHPEIPMLKSVLLSMNGNLDKTSYASVYNTESGKKQLDDINVLYVAFTRAVNRLYLISHLPEGRTSAAIYYSQFLESKQMWDSHKLEYEFGQQVTFSGRKNHKASGMTILRNTISNDWRNKISLSRESEQIWSDEKLSAEKDYGNLMHTALSRIGNKTEIMNALGSMQSEGLLTIEEGAFLAQKIKKLLAKPEVETFFELELNVKTETDIIVSKGKSIRPDRLIFYSDKVAVLDYKTGVEKESHKTQINTYAKALINMGYDCVEKFILYTETEKLLRVDLP